MKSLPLADTNILITRPPLFAADLATQIALLGGKPHKLATISIQINIPQAPNIKDFSYAVFISRHAVFFGVPYLQAHSINIEKFIAIGKTTATALLNDKISDISYPKQLPYNSHELLRMPELQDVNNKNIIIFKGQHGLDLIATTLQQRGARVCNSIVYKQLLPKHHAATIQKKLCSTKLDIIIITSQLGLENLLKLATIRVSASLLQIPLLVVSKRLKMVATTLGFTTIIIAAAADDLSITTALTNWRLQGAVK